MAKLLYTAIVADIRNKLNGTVFSKNRSGAYIRTKVSPVNAQTADQTIVRQRLGSLSAQWRALTPTQRAGWNTATEFYPRTDQFGNTYLMSGLSLFVSLNANLALNGNTPLVDAPMPVEMPEYTIDSIVADASASTIALTMIDDVPTDCDLIIQATVQSSPGRNYFKNGYRQIRVFGDGSTTPMAIGTEYEAKFGNLVEGMKLSIRCYLVNKVTGQAGVPTTADTIVVA